MSVEQDVIRRFFSWPVVDDTVKVPIGDDAAVVEASGATVVCADTMVAGTHFSEDIPPRAVGWKALAVNLSDCAAMGACPKWMTLCLTLPHVDFDWLEGFAQGLRACAEQFGVSLIGGDTTRGSVTTISIQLMGGLVRSQCMRRSGASPGELIVVTGSFGRAAHCLQFWQNTGRHVEHDNRLWYPNPRVGEGLALAPLASAAIDVSDGFLNDLEHIMEQSGCSATVDLEALPLDRHACRSQALGGGEDYELIFTLGRCEMEMLQSEWPSHLAPITVVGNVGECADLGGGSPRINLVCEGRVLSSHEWPIQTKGFSHF